jgi:hypothetical protein
MIRQRTGIAGKVGQAGDARRTNEMKDVVVIPCWLWFCCAAVATITRQRLRRTNLASYLSDSSRHP